MSALQAKRNEQIELKAAAVFVEDDFTGWVSEWFDCRQFHWVRVFLAYNADTETSCNVQVQSADVASLAEDGTGAPVAGSNIHIMGVAQAPSTAGISNLSKHQVDLVAADFDDPDTCDFIVRTTGASLMRVRAKGTGGTTQGTLAARVEGD